MRIRRRIGVAAGSRGSVTAEAAVVLPVLALVMFVAMWGVGVATAHMRCVDAARTAARAVARGEPDAQARAAAAAAAPKGARVSVERVGGSLVRVRVEAAVAGPGALLSALGPMHVDGSAVAAVEEP